MVTAEEGGVVGSEGGGSEFSRYGKVILGKLPEDEVRFQAGDLDRWRWKWSRGRSRKRSRGRGCRGRNGGKSRERKCGARHVWNRRRGWGIVLLLLMR